MEIQEIKQLCVNGSSQYLDYLTKNNKGRSIIKIHAISQVPKSPGVFKLELSIRIFELDAIVFQYLPTGNEFDTAKLKIREYDYDRNILFIKQEGELPFDLTRTRPDDLVIISDLKFLVQRILDFYRLQGDRIRLPHQSSNSEMKIDDFKFLSDSIPDENQKRVLLAIFHHPVVYVWGAPGTGKTRFVLSYSVIEYIKQNKRVAIFAPTNVALEQVLIGVLSITDKAAIKRDKILRIGNPSRVFAADYPEVCEVTGAQKKLTEINRQISIIERISGVDDTSHDQALHSEFESLIKKIDPLNNQIKSSGSKLKNVELQLAEYDKKIAVQGKQIKLVIDTIDKQEQRLTSISHQFVKFFTSKETSLEGRIRDLHTQHKTLEEVNYSLSNSRSQLDSERKIVSTSLAEYERNRSELFEQIKGLPFKLSSLNELKSSFTLTNLSLKATEVFQIILSQREEEGITEELKHEYSGYSITVLNAKLEELKRQRSILEKMDTTERIKSVNVIAATFDGFVGRFPEADLKIDHVFIDEAGYANIVKSLVPFVFNKPVTLLGDHYQLPPVSELNDLNTTNEMTDTIVWTQSAIYSCNVFDRSKDALIGDYINNTQSITPLVKRENLTKTHRFGSNLAKIINEFVYRNGFHSNLSHGETRIRFINATKGRSLGKRDNLNEIGVIKRYLLTSQSDISGHHTLAILAPYNDQIIHLGKEFPELRKDHRILTVHKSQGREWNTVILSVCDTSNMWFTDTTNPKSKGLNLINTAVSRAKKELIIVCDYNFWIGQRGQLIQGLLSVAEEISV
ncbi:MAG: ATP-binding domain-containing protein [Cyclobacteriaceae bacterium]|nr:ATP-binding domain-containing protein [Cyclobacteriaceae bacterium]